MKPVLVRRFSLKAGRSCTNLKIVDLPAPRGPSRETIGKQGRRVTHFLLKGIFIALVCSTVVVKLLVVNSKKGRGGR